MANRAMKGGLKSSLRRHRSQPDMKQISISRNCSWMHTGRKSRPTWTRSRRTMICRRNAVRKEVMSVAFAERQCNTMPTHLDLDRPQCSKEDLLKSTSYEDTKKRRKVAQDLCTTDSRSTSYPPANCQVDLPGSLSPE